MRNKNITQIVLIIVIGIIAFLIGRMTVQQDYEKTHLDLENDLDYDLACDFMSTIVDWNTNEEELSVMTENGYEFYAYRSDSVYNTLAFITTK